MGKEIWVPSKARIREALAQDLSIALQASPSIREVVFGRFVNDNAGVLAWIGEEQRRQLIQDVVEVTENLDYER